MTYCVRQQFYILTSRPVVTVFGVKHLYGKNNLHCEIHGFTTAWASNAEPNMQKRPNKIFFSTHTHLEKTKSIVMMCIKPSTIIVKFIALSYGFRS